MDKVQMTASFRFPFCIVLAVLHFATARAEQTPPERFFEQTIEPLLAEHCYKCHSHSADKIKGGLVLDSAEALLAGGDSGPAIVPGHPEKSLLIEAVRYANDDLQMPPKGKKLTDAQIAALTEWVKLGAPIPKKASSANLRPRGMITEDDRKWWAFQP